MTTRSCSYMSHLDFEPTGKFGGWIAWVSPSCGRVGVVGLSTGGGALLVDLFQEDLQGVRIVVPNLEV